MKYGISLKINCSQIDKARLFKGKKGQYLDATIFLDTENVSQFGDNGMVTQDVSKEERAQNVRGNILGNAKIFYTADGGQGQQGGYAPQIPPQQQQPPKQQYQQPPQQQYQPQGPAQGGEYQTPGQPVYDGTDVPF